MESDLEERWNEAVRQKNLTSEQLKLMIEELERGITIPENWNQRCLASIKREKAEIEERYGIRIEKTEIRCSRCGRPWGFGNHTCLDIRFQKLNEGKEQIKANSTLEHCKRIKAIGRRKAAIKLGVDHHTVNGWIRKGIVPLKYQEPVMNL